MTFEELMKDEAFQKLLYEAKDLEQVQTLFETRGVTLTEEELMKRLLPAGDELGEPELEGVSGGGSVLNWVRSRIGFGGGGSMGGR